MNIKKNNFPEKDQLYRELEISEQQIKDGQVSDAREALAELRDKYGL